eukprot:EG_transcript_12253
MFLWVVVSLVAAWLLWRWLQQRRPPGQRPEAPRVLVVLGSGGHTTEMFYALGTLQWDKFRPVYVVAATDQGSAQKAKDFEAKYSRPAALRVIPRAREVGQSYVTSVFTTLRAFGSAVVVVWQDRPDLVLCNGPGTCVPIAVSALLFTAAGLLDTRVVYSESFACVHHLSLSGRILYPLAHGFAVEWQQLAQLYPRAVWAGRDLERARQDGGGEPERKYGDFVLITVGSTKFDALIQAADCSDFLAAIRQLGFRKLKVQHGATTLHLRSLTPGEVHGVEVECFAYDPDVPRMIATAGLVISHAGAGSILDALLSGARVVVVPNPVLMNDHQAQLAEALRTPYRFVWSCSCTQLLPFLVALQLNELTPFPKHPTDAFARLVDRTLGI